MNRLSRSMARLVCLICLSTALFPASGVRAQEPIRAELVRVLDGDSLLVRTGQGIEEVRLIGVDCPEGGQEYGDLARDFTREQCAGQPLALRLDQETRDRYGRLLAYVDTPRGSLNLALVRAGLAVAYPFGRNRLLRAELARAEDEARAAGAGFWAKGGLDQTPEQFRRTSRE